jgi:hypothetical protein
MGLSWQLWKKKMEKNKSFDDILKRLQELDHQID